MSVCVFSLVRSRTVQPSHCRDVRAKNGQCATTMTDSEGLVSEHNEGEVALITLIVRRRNNRVRLGVHSPFAEQLHISDIRPAHRNDQDRDHDDKIAGSEP